MKPTAKAFLVLVLCVLSLPTVNAFSPAKLAKKMNFPLSAQMQDKPTLQASDYVLTQDADGETFQVNFLEEPSEFHYKLTEKHHQYLLSFCSMVDDEDEELDDEDNLFDSDLMCPKEVDIYFSGIEGLAGLEGGDLFQVLIVTSFMQPQSQVVDAISLLLDKTQSSWTSECNGDWCEEVVFSFTPLLQDENGHYTTDLFYSCVDSYFEDEEYSWAKMVVTSTHIYWLGVYSEKNNPKVATEAQKLLASLEIH